MAVFTPISRDSVSLYPACDPDIISKPASNSAKDLLGVEDENLSSPGSSGDGGVITIVGINAFLLEVKDSVANTEDTCLEELRLSE